jgi:hypothetical protein
MVEDDWQPMVTVMRAVIDRGGEPFNMATLSGPAGLLFTVQWQYLGDDFKEDIPTAIGSLGRCFGATRVVSVLDSWMLVMADKNEVPSVRPAEDARSVEALQIVDVTSAGCQGSGQIVYGREDDGTVVWREPEFTEHGSLGGPVIDGWRYGLRNTFPLLFPLDAPDVVGKLTAMTGGFMLMPHTEQVLNTLRSVL